MSKLIVVQGSEDGIQGIFTNKKLAFECAKDYCEAGAENTLNGMTYAKFCKEMSATYSCQVGEGYGVAYCSTFYKNQY
jgi:enoyl-[acyl-carrier-protein] reductase (NADH)